MDPHRFDHLVRRFGTLWTRRGLARLLTGATLATVLGGSHVPVTQAKKGKGKKRPKKCKNGTIKCGGICVNTTTNAKHCGGCGQDCGNGETCVDGQCLGGGCAGGQILCNALCVDPTDNRDHCGRCNDPCDSDEFCVDGSCTPCPPGHCPPGDSCCDGACVNLAISNTHCGACFNACPPGGLSCCGGSCVDVFENRDHCMMCGNKCEDGQICCGGCRDPDTLLTDGDHCGACRNSCRDILGPEPLYAFCCGGACTDIQEDRDNCGGCDIVCDTGYECQSQGAGNPPARCVQVAGGGDE